MAIAARLGSMFAASGNTSNGITVERLARMAATLARLAISRLRRLVEAPKASAYCDACAARFERDTAAPPCPSTTERARKRGDSRGGLHSVLAGAWAALLLAIVAYAVLEGEHVLAQLESLKVLAAYSTGVRRVAPSEPPEPARGGQPHQSSSA